MDENWWINQSLEGFSEGYERSCWIKSIRGFLCRGRRSDASKINLLLNVFCFAFYYFLFIYNNYFLKI